MNDGSGAAVTYFAPAERAHETKVTELRLFVENSPLFRAIEQAVDGYLMILNRERQVLAANHQLLRDLGLETTECVVGRRPGEILDCVHAMEGPGGCGTSPFCATCGAVLSILTSQKEGQPAQGECLATVRRGEHTEATEFRVRSTPVRLGAHELTVLVFNDISGEKRREALERTFFHDILNTITGLMGWSHLLEKMGKTEPKEMAERIVALSNRLNREVQDQRRLSQAERGSLQVTVEKTSVQGIYETLQSIFSGYDVAKSKTIEFDPVAAEEDLLTDASLLARVLTNMIKNALEAIPDGETVRVRFERQGGDPVFLVHNPGAVPPEVAMRIFQRSFSTKEGKGRGIGTYSMKLFGEKFLGGKVSFQTSEKGGTIFSIRLPAAGPPEVPGPQ
jgi:signal transduction histidine kinase